MNSKFYAQLRAHGQKRCSACKRILSIEMFSKSQDYCKDCNWKQVRDWKLKNPEKRRAQERRRFARQKPHRDLLRQQRIWSKLLLNLEQKIKVAQAKYDQRLVRWKIKCVWTNEVWSICPNCQTPHEHGSDRQRFKGILCHACDRLRDKIRYAGDPELRERVRRATRQWYVDHPEARRRKNKAGKLRRDALKKSVPAKTLDPRIIFTMTGGRCGICGGQLLFEDPWDVDHIIPLSHVNRGCDDHPPVTHTYENVQPAHPDCNHRKRDEFLVTCALAPP